VRPPGRTRRRAPSRAARAVRAVVIALELLRAITTATTANSTPAADPNSRSAGDFADGDAADKLRLRHDAQIQRVEREIQGHGGDRADERSARTLRTGSPLISSATYTAAFQPE
jgi:hypothetical protein